jgi:hypothetical protein
MNTKSLEKTKALMGALVRMKPKQHEDMKIGKKQRAPKRKKVVAKSKS